MRGPGHKRVCAAGGKQAVTLCTIPTAGRGILQPAAIKA